MKKLMLIAALVCGAFFVNSCDKDDNGSSGKDPVTNLADYIDKPYSQLASDCEKSGYIKTIIAGGSSFLYGYVKTNYSIGTLMDDNGNCISIINLSGVEVQTGQQFADHLRRAYTSLTGRYGDTQMSISAYNTIPGSSQGIEDYETIDELCTAIAAVPVGTYDAVEISFKGDNKRQEFYLSYYYSYDGDTNLGAVMESYSSPSAV